MAAHLTHSKSAVRKLAHSKPVSVARSRLHGRVFRHFATKLGFVYFGYVDQRDDEHRLIRGFTLSNTHRDDNYCLGTYHGYDVALCERTDMVRTLNLPAERKKWLIITADIHRHSNLPHVVIGRAAETTGFYRHLMTKFAYLQQMQPGKISPYDHAFCETFTMYTKPTNAVAAEKLFGGDLNMMLAQHFPDFSFEIWGTTLYVYTQTKRPTSALLARMLQCVSWLANEIDKRD